MSRLARCGVLVVLLCVVASARAFAQDPIDAMMGRTVTAVRVEIEGKPAQSPQVLGLIDVHAGEPLQIAAVRSSENRLLGVGGYEDVRVLATQVAGGLDVLFQLQPRHPIERVQYRGDTGLTPRALRNLVEHEYGGSIVTSRQRTMVALTQTALVGEGYTQATVTASVEYQHRPERGILVLNVKAGPRVTIAHTTVKLTGSAAPTERDVLKKTGAAPGQPYRPFTIDQKLTDIRDKLRAKEHYEASASHTMTPVAGTDSVDLVIAIDSGDRVVLTSAGDTWPLGDWKQLVPIATVGSADNDLLDDWKTALTTAARRGGYVGAQVAYTRAAVNGATVITYNFALGPRYFIDRVELVGETALPSTITLRQVGLVPDAVYEPGAVSGAAARIRSEYYLQGFYLASVDVDPVEQIDLRTPTSRRMLVRLTIATGVRGTVREIVFATPPTVAETALRDLMKSKVGGPFVSATMRVDQDALAAFYRNAGYLSAAPVVIPTRVDEGRGVILTVDPHEGPQSILEDIRIVGNSKVSEQAIRGEMTLHPGEPFGDAKRLESQRRLLETRLFRHVTFTPESTDGGKQMRLLVAVEEAPTITYSYGGGVEAPLRRRHTLDGGLEDRREFSPRGSFEITRRNLFGRNQDISFFSRVSLTPKTSDDPLIDGHGVGFSDYRVATLYKDEHAFRSTTSIAFGASSEQGIRPTYNYLRRGLSAEAQRPIRRGLNLSGKYALDFTRIFDSRIPESEQPIIDRLLPGVRLSIFSAGLSWDRRDRGLSPTSGTLFTADGETALRPLGSAVGYTKAFFQSEWFKSSNTSRVVTLGLRGQLGVAHGFARDVPVVDENGQPALGPDGQPLTQRVEDLPASQRFYAGGSTTVRGFAQDRLGVPAIITEDGLSVGGSGMVVVNAELRTTLGKIFGYRIGIVGFVDSGNVFSKASDIDLRQLRSAAGFGFRFDSPIGALRTDFGFKLDRHTIGGKLERGWEFHLNFGEAF